MPYIEAREAHYEQFFGPITQPIMHATDGQDPHVDVYQFEPAADRPYWVLITGGMSDRRQCVPPEFTDHVARRTEILLHAAEPKPWMFHVLKGVAEMPFEERTFLHWWHTVPNGRPMTAEPSELTNFLFLPPYYEGADFDTFQLDGERVDFLWLVPITDGELSYKLTHGAEALEMLFEEARLSPVIDEQRLSLVAAEPDDRKWWQAWRS
jgi:hypothetical protein